MPVPSGKIPAGSETTGGPAHVPRSDHLGRVRHRWHGFRSLPGRCGRGRQSHHAGRGIFPVSRRVAGSTPRGKFVTPGFVDLHTHLDAQIGWDPEMKSSSYHGVTTALIGNCGVTFAPVRKANHRLLAELMEAVEDIEADAIMDGLPWDWTTYGGYLDAVRTTRARPQRRGPGWPLGDPLRGHGRQDRWTKACRRPTPSSTTSAVWSGSRWSREPSASRLRASSATGCRTAG